MRRIVPGLLLAVVTATCPATDYTSAASFDATFTCPEQLPDEATRAADLKAYIAWMHAQHPGWSMPKITGARLYVLIGHHCEETLAAIHKTRSIH